jgi:hypothetical protein
VIVPHRETDCPQKSVSPRSPHLSRFDFYLRGHLKDKVYESNPHNLDEIRKKNIRRFIGSLEVTVVR